MAKAGRPKAEVTRQKVVSVRMKQDEYARLKRYADAFKMTVTQVVQQGVEKVLEEEGAVNGND